MNEKKERKKIREFLKMNKRTGIVAAVLACALLVGVSITVYSKYYKTGYNPGMATASGFYFNSNYMAAVDELRGITEEKMANIPAEVLETIIRSANDTSWVEGSEGYSFYVYVQNYDNQLLYNDKDLDVEYEVRFMLLGEPVGANYSVTFDHQTQSLTWENGKGSIATFQGSLPGGRPNADSYELRVALDQSTDAVPYEPTDVLMVAYPIGPEYLQGTKSIAGIIRANYEQKEFDIGTESGFVIRNDEAYKKDWKDTVLQESAYEYRVYTTGNYTGNGAATRRTIRVMWRSDMYQINEFDEYYKQAKGNGRISANGNWTVMEIDVLPFASIKFLFFRNKDFVSIINAMDDDNSSDFEESVKVEKVEIP